MDKGMKSALCETGRVPGRVDRNIRVFSMTLKNAVTKGVKAWRDRRVGYWLCIDPKTGEYYLSFQWRAKNEGDEEITDNEYIRHCLSLFEPTGFYLDDVILGPAKQPTEGKVFGNVIEECLEAFFSACCEDVKYFEFYENGICIRHR